LFAKKLYYIVFLGVPMCKSFNQLQSLRYDKTGLGKWNAVVKEGEEHFNFRMMPAHKIQIDNGVSVLHEDPWGASG